MSGGVNGVDQLRLDVAFKVADSCQQVECFQSYHAEFFSPPNRFAH